MANRRGKGGSSDRFPLLGLWNRCERWLQLWNQKMIASWQESDGKPRQCVERQRHYSADKGPYSQGYGLPSGHVWLWELDRKEDRVPKIWCLWTVVLQKTPESVLDCKIKPVNQSQRKSTLNTHWKDWCQNYSILVIWCGKFWKRWEYQTTWPASWETCMQVRKQQLELDMEQQTGSK